MIAARRFHTATSLPNGKVLVAGGNDGTGGAFSSAELHDPASGTFTTTGYHDRSKVKPYGDLARERRSSHCRWIRQHLSFKRGAVQPSQRTLRNHGMMTTARAQHTAALLADGKVLITGGLGDTTSDLSSAELYDPATATFATTGTMTEARDLPVAALLANGKVLIAGGSRGAVRLSSADLYNPANGTFSATGLMATARNLHTATPLPERRYSSSVVIVANSYLSSAELYFY